MEDVLTELRLLSETLDRQQPSVRHHIEAQTRENQALWEDIAALRDETHTSLAALANRLESLAKGLTVDPAQVAEAMFRCIPDESGGLRDADA